MDQWGTPPFFCLIQGVCAPSPLGEALQERATEPNAAGGYSCWVCSVPRAVWSDHLAPCSNLDQPLRYGAVFRSIPTPMLPAPVVDGWRGGGVFLCARLCPVPGGEGMERKARARVSPEGA